MRGVLRRRSRCWGRGGAMGERSLQGFRKVLRGVERVDITVTCYVFGPGGGSSGGQWEGWGNQGGGSDITQAYLLWVCPSPYLGDVNLLIQVTLAVMEVLRGRGRGKVPHVTGHRSVLCPWYCVGLRFTILTGNSCVSWFTEIQNEYCTIVVCRVLLKYRMNIVQ